MADAFAIRYAQFMNTSSATAFFWSPEQYGVLKRRLAVFRSGYGTGKTLLLLQKAIELLRAGERVLFVVATVHDSVRHDTFLTNSLRRMFAQMAETGDFNPELVDINQVKTSTVNAKFLNESLKSSNVFVDELVMDASGGDGVARMLA